MKNYAYISLLTEDSYTYGIMMLAESLRQTKAAYPLHVLITNNVSKASQEILNQINVTYELVDTISVTDSIDAHNKKIHQALSATWHDCWTKFKIYDLVQYDKIVFLDADVLVLKNLDDLFDKPHMTSCLDGEYFNIWPGWDHFNSGCLVIEPNHEEFEKILNFSMNFPEDQYPDYVLADQEMLNLYYKDWPNQKELHLNKYYDIFAPYVLEEQLEDLIPNCYFVHYVGRKPWVFWVKSQTEVYSEYYYTQGRELIQNAYDKLDKKKISDAVVVTVYAICKDEKNNVKKWLNSFNEADYVCILDTGSTDGTWELLQKLAKKNKKLIIDQKIIKPWRYDVARNESMKLIPQETTMFFMADLDEIIKESGWVKKVKDAWMPSFDRGMYDYHRDIDDNGNIKRTIKEYRIHSRAWDHYENIVHEALINKAGFKKFYIETSTPIDIAVWHYPDREKQKHYVELCEADLIEYPNDYVMRLQLAIEYEIVGNWEKAYEHYNWLLQHETTLQRFEIARCFSGIAKSFLFGQNNIQMALNYFREGRLFMPEFVDNYLDAAQVCYNIQDYKTAGILCEEALKYCGISNWCNVHDINSYLVYYMASLSYYQQGDLIKALAYAEIASTLNPEQDYINLRNELIMRVRASWQSK